jgi:hypothetical protein
VKSHGFRRQTLTGSFYMQILRHILTLSLLAFAALPATVLAVDDPTVEDQNEEKQSFFGEKKDPFGDDEIFDGEIEIEPELEVEQEAENVSSMDTASSINIISDIAGLFTSTYDARAIYSWSDTDLRDNTSTTGDEITGRFRWETSWNARDNLRFKARMAFICSTNSCDPDLQLDADLEGNTLPPGSTAVDEFLVQWFRTDRGNLALGRLQTKFVTRGGVFNKSLDRNNSHNVRVNWTDGLQGTRTLADGSGWVAHFIAEYNNRNGPSNVRREPLNFSDNGSRYSYFAALENNQSEGYWVQRSIDLTWLPDALLKDGTETGPREDYVAVVGRLAARYPAESAGRRLRFAAEYGYAFETPRASAVSLAGDEADGNAWNATVSMMDFIPDHSIGVLYGETGGGWLISPQYINDERQIELRYLWTPRNNFSIEARIRIRKAMHQRIDAARKDEDLNFFLRFTWRYDPEGIN